jgi:hypothetical protein
MAAVVPVTSELAFILNAARLVPRGDRSWLATRLRLRAVH